MTSHGAATGRDQVDVDVDVVILTWNDGPLLDVAVRSAAGSVGLNVGVVVVDNGSDPAAEVIDSDVRLVRNTQNRGVAAGRNQGAMIGSAPLLCFLDSDAELQPRSLRRLMTALEDPTVGIAVPVFSGQAPEASGGCAPTLRVKAARAMARRVTYEPTHRRSGATQWDVDFGIGACQLIRRSVFEEVGGLDERIFYGPEDVDFCLRVRAVGYRVVQVDDVGVVHPPRRAFRRPLSARGVRHGWSIVKHLWRHRRRR